MQAVISIPLTGKLTIEEDGLLDFWEKTYETFQTYEMRSFHSFTHWQMICFSFPLLFQFSFSSRVLSLPFYLFNLLDCSPHRLFEYRDKSKFLTSFHVLNIIFY